MDRFKPLHERPKILQNHSFFSFPTIYFGTHEISEEEWVCEDPNWTFSDPWHISINTNLASHEQNKIGLYILWCDSENENDSPEM